MSYILLKVTYHKTTSWSTTRGCTLLKAFSNVKYSLLYLVFLVVIHHYLWGVHCFMFEMPLEDHFLFLFAYFISWLHVWHSFSYIAFIVTCTKFNVSCLPVFIFNIHSYIFDINCYIFYVMYFIYVELVKFDMTWLLNTNMIRINSYGSSNLTRLLNGSCPNWLDFFPYRVKVKVLISFTRLMTWLYFLF